MKHLIELKDGDLNCSRRIEKNKYFTTESTTMVERGLI